MKLLSPGWRYHDELSRYGLCFHGTYSLVREKGKARHSKTVYN